MSFHGIPSPTVSAAEWEIRKQLELKGLKMQYQEMVILDAHNVDISGINRKQEFHGFEIDGPVHRIREKVKLRDEFLDEVFARRHLHVWHLPYDPPLSLKRRDEIVDFIFEKMGVSRMKPTYFSSSPRLCIGLGSLL
jgi:hypothetical protein